MVVLICTDRDGTLNIDENYYLGSAKNWKEQVSFYETVPIGIAVLNHIPNSYFYITTNQSGVSVKNKFKDLDEKRMNEVCKYIIDELESIEISVNIEELKLEINNTNLKINGYKACPYVNNAYVKKKEGKYIINPKYIDDTCEDLKPKPGMIKKAQQDLINQGLEIEATYMIGDRASDVMCGINAGAKISVLIESFKTKECGDVKKIKELIKQHGDRIYVAKNFLDAAIHIYKDSNNFNKK